MHMILLDITIFIVYNLDVVSCMRALISLLTPSSILKSVMYDNIASYHNYLSLY
jgi:hypothetical protein